MSNQDPWPRADGLSADDLPSIKTALEKLAVVRRLNARAQRCQRHRPSAAEKRAALAKVLLAARQAP
jgi:hypothetical protein